MFKSLWYWFLSVFRVSGPNYRVGSLAVIDGKEAGVVTNVRYMRPTGLKTREWHYDLYLFKFDSKKVVKITTYITTVPQWKLELAEQ